MTVKELLEHLLTTTKQIESKKTKIEQVEVSSVGVLTDDLLELSIAKVCLDSREVVPGALFIAVPGIRNDGRKYILQAIKQGAVVVIAESDAEINADAANNFQSISNIPVIYVKDLVSHVGKIISQFYVNPSHQQRIVGVTGTNGKTSTCYYIAQILSELSAPCAVIGTIGSGLPFKLEKTTHTTPDQLTLQSKLSEFLQQGIFDVAMEVSSHGMVQHRVDGVKFDTVVFTNLTQDHGDYHANKFEYWQAKLKLFLPTDQQQSCNLKDEAYIPKVFQVATRRSAQMSSGAYSQYVSSESSRQQRSSLKGEGYRCAVVNMDDPYGRQLLALLPAEVKVIAYSLQSQENPVLKLINRENTAVLSLSNINYEENSITAEINFAAACKSIKDKAAVEAGIAKQNINFQSLNSGLLQIRLLGEGSLYNVLAAVAVCLGYGYEFTDVLGAANKLIAPAGRMQIVTPEQDKLTIANIHVPRIVVDYAHTPAALAQALLALKRHCRGKLFCVFGCGGDRDRSKRPLMLAEALKYSDEVIITQDNPRTESQQQILADILQSTEYKNLPNNIQINLDRKAAIKQAITAATVNDMILIAGKGHEDYQIIGDDVLHFSDLEVAQAVLEGN